MGECLWSFKEGEDPGRPVWSPEAQISGSHTSTTDIIISGVTDSHPVIDFDVALTCKRQVTVTWVI